MRANEDGELLPPVVVDVPDVLYLQVVDEGDCEDWPAPSEPDERTHCADRINASDVAYVPLARAERAEGERDALRAELDAALEMLKQTTDGLNAYRQVAERVGALNVLPGASWDTPDPKPVGRVEVLVLREAVWCDDVEEWEDTQTDKCLRTVVAWRPGRAAPGDGGEEAG